MTASKRKCVAASLLFGVALLASPAAAEEPEETMPEPPRIKMNLTPVNQSLSQLLDAGYQVISFTLSDGSDAGFVVARGGHHVFCFVDRNGYSQCMGLN